jgi:hypothetical protein
MKVQIIAELAQGFEGRPEQARLLLRAAAAAGADAAKYQLVYADELAIESTCSCAALPPTRLTRPCPAGYTMRCDAMRCDGRSHAICPAFIDRGSASASV